MNFRWPQFAFALAVFAAGGAWAQQPIIFSRPVEKEPSEKANSFLSTEPTHRAPNAFNAPAPLFGFGNEAPSYDLLPGVNQIQRQVSPAERKAWEKLLESKKNWILLTPEEILGIPTPEKILGIPEKNDDAKLSIEQRYLKRQERATAFAATNGYRGPELKPRDPNNPFARLEEASRNDNPLAQLAGESARPTPAGPPKFFTDVFGVNPITPLTPQQRQEATWGNTFGLPAQPAKQTPEQLAGMERFRALMEPGAALEKALPAARTALPLAKNVSLEGGLQFNSLGGSVKTLSPESGRAKGITPLPSLIRPQLATPPPSPAQSQLPPWLREAEGTPKLKVGRF